MKKNVVLSLLGLVLLVSAVAAFNMACAENPPTVRISRGNG